MPYLEALNFHLVGFGCTTCIGNSGPLPDAVAEAVTAENLIVAAVLSGKILEVLENVQGLSRNETRMANDESVAELAEALGDLTLSVARLRRLGGRAQRAALERL